MGQVISYRQLQRSGGAGALKPLIFCGPGEAYLSEAISIERLLLDKLLGDIPKFRNRHVIEHFESVIASLPDDSVITDIDVLFNPNYPINILAMMVSACKRRNFSVVWPGKFVDNKLIYGEDGYKDYKEYNISDYDITCVVQEVEG